MRTLLLVLALLLAGCPADDDDDSAPVDDIDGDADWSHCPSASTAVEDAAWGGELEVGPEALFCHHPGMFWTLDEVRGSKKIIRVVEGSYRYPLEATEEPWYLPICAWSPGGTTPHTSEGIVSAEQAGGWGEDIQDVSGLLTTDVGDGLAVRLWIAVDDDRWEVDGTGSFGAGLSMRECVGDNCWAQGSFEVCRLEPDMCDLWSFDRGSIALEQHHWAGNAGSGFAALLWAGGQWDGAPFEVREYWRLHLAYGHHAFTREAMVFFDQPIGEVCGLYLSEVGSMGGDDEVYATVDCDGAILEELTPSGHDHLYNQPCPEAR